MILRQFLVPETACASYLFGCTTHRKLAVVDPHASLVEEYVSAGEQIGSAIVAVLDHGRGGPVRRGPGISVGGEGASDAEYGLADVCHARTVRVRRASS